MREPRTRIPGLILNRQAPGRVAFLPADVDRRYAMDALPDHGDLLANLVRWAAGDHFPLRVEGPGLIDCHLYRQAHRLILHLVNLTVTSGRGPVEESLPLGPLVVRLALPAGITGKSVRLLVSNKSASITVKRGWLTVTLPAVLDHEVLVIS